MLNVSYEKREKYIIAKREEMAKRILTGKIQKANPEDREQIRNEKIAERYKFEEGRNGGYELIFPSKDEKRNKDYESFI